MTWDDLFVNYRLLSKLKYQVLWEMEENDLPDSVKIYHRNKNYIPEMRKESKWFLKAYLLTQK